MMSVPLPTTFPTTGRPVRRSNSAMTSWGKPRGYVGNGASRTTPHSSQCPVVLSFPADAGCNVAIFPEGTTTDGSTLLHFHAALLQPAIACGHPVQPLALQYRSPDDRFSDTAAYVGDMSLAECIANIIAARCTIARITVAAPIATADGIDRRTLAAQARATIAGAIEVAPAGHD